MARFAIALLPLALGLLPIAAPAQTSTPAALPQTSVMRAPVTFSASSNNGPQNAAPDDVTRSRTSEAVREQRYAQERAFVQKYGRGVPVKLRARRY